MQPRRRNGLLRGACHRARIRATRWLAMTARYSFAFPRRDTPELFINLSPEEGVALPQGGSGECRVPIAPAASCAKCRKHTSVVTTVAPGSPGIPARDGFNSLFRALPGDRAFLSPSPADLSSVNLTPASRRQDHTTSPSTSRRSRQQRRPRPSHPRPTFVTIAKRPLCVGRDGKRCRGDLPQK
jgi:hypothetical protein